MNQHIQSTDPTYTSVLTSVVESCTALGCNVWAPCSACVKQTDEDFAAYELDMLDMLKKEIAQRPEGEFSMCSYEHPCDICAVELVDAEDIEMIKELDKAEGEILLAYEQSLQATHQGKSINEFWATPSVINAISEIEEKAFEFKKKLVQLEKTAAA